MMMDYNQAPAQGKFDFLWEYLYLPNEPTLKHNYNGFRCSIADSRQHILPEWENVPVIVFPLIDNYGITFDKTTQRFSYLQVHNRWHFFYQKIMMDMQDRQTLYRECDELYRCDMVDALCQELNSAVKQARYDGEYADKLGALCEYDSEQTMYFYFAAKYALAAGNAAKALAYAKNAYSRRKNTAAVWLLMAVCHRAYGNPAQEALFRSLALTHAKIPFPSLPNTDDKNIHDNMVMGGLQFGYAPFYSPILPKAELKTDKIFDRLKAAHGRFLPCETVSNYWCGIFNNFCIPDYEILKLKAAEAYSFDNVFKYNGYVFDIMPATITDHTRINATAGEPLVVPLAGTKDHHNPTVKDEQHQAYLPLGNEEWFFFRFETPSEITSDHSFAVAPAIHLFHSPKRKKLVLKLFLDSLSWYVMKRTNFRYVPNLRRFFAKGITFSHNYSPAEYTFPSYAMIETGMYMENLQVLDEKIFAPIDSRYVTMTQMAKAAGYYTAILSGDALGLYNGIHKGMDRLIVNPYYTAPTVAGIRRTIDHLDAFEETDNYILMHVSDPHMLAPKLHMTSYTSTHTVWSGYMNPGDTSQAAVFLPGWDSYRKDNLYMIRRMDEELAELFTYIENHYDEDEYVVCAYSDHGISVFADTDFMLSESLTNASLMLRGAGVPALGDVDELTSSMDLYPILVKLLGRDCPDYPLDANLPEAFGGKKREYVMSNSQFPGEPYRLAIRTENYEFWLQTHNKVRSDGTVALEPFEYRIYTRDQNRYRINADDVKTYFLNLVYERTKLINQRNGL